MTSKNSHPKSILDTYRKICKTHHSKPLQQVVQQLKNADAGSSVLNLTGCNLSVTDCDVLAKTLTNTNAFHDLQFGDSLLPEEGLVCLIGCITNNGFVKTLDLKGNNIRGKSVVAVAKLLKENQSLQSLHLEWNNLGLLPENFTVFADSIAVNQGLQILDLKNNQISHADAAYLAQALEKNSHLIQLDLRWNNIGLLGGQALLSALRANRTLHKLDLQGNNIPLEIMRAIDSTLRRNQEFKDAVNEHRHREIVLRRELEQIGNVSTMQFETMAMQMKKQENSNLHQQKISSNKIGHLVEALDEHKTAINTLEAKIAVLQKSLDLTNEQNKALSEQLANEKQNNSDLREKHLSILRHEREEYTEKEQMLLKELHNSKEITKKLEQKVAELEIVISTQEKQLANSETEISQMKNDIATKQTLANEELKKLQQQHFEQMQVLNKKLDKNEIANSNQAAQIRELQSDIKLLEKQKKSLEQEVSSLEVQGKTSQTRFEESLRASTLAKEKAEIQCEHMKSNNHEFRLKCDSLLQDLEVQKKMCSQFDKVLEAKEEMAKLLYQTQLELRECQKTKDQREATNESLRQAIKQTEINVASQDKEHKSHLKQKDLEIANLKNSLLLKEQHWKQMCEKDSQRTAVLKSAFMAYFQGTNQETSSTIPK